jgi:hypothetical protein
MRRSARRRRTTRRMIRRMIMRKRNVRRMASILGRKMIRMVTGSVKTSGKFEGWKVEIPATWVAMFDASLRNDVMIL